MNQNLILWLLVFFSALPMACGRKAADCPDCPGASTASSTLAIHYKSQWGILGMADGQFNQPSGVAVDKSNDVYVADWGNNRIQKFTSNGDFIAVWGGVAAGTSAGQFNNPYGITADLFGNVYVADATNNRIQKLPAGLDGSVGSNWLVFGGTSTGTIPGQFNNPIGVGVDASGDLFVTDDYNNRIQKLPVGADGTVGSNWTTFGGLASGAAPGQFDDPIGLAFNAAGDLYVTDTDNHRIQKLPAGENGAVGSNWVTFGTSGSNPGQFNTPVAPGFDFSGNFYVADVFVNRIDILPAGKDGTVGSNWVTLGGPVSSNPGEFNNPHGVALDGFGDLYVVDNQNNRIQKFAP
jgi:tripartite motif-containing protein 71